MKPRSYLLLAAASVLLIAAPARTARRPRYGGTLRLEIEASIRSLDPAVAAASPAEAAAKRQLDLLLYDHRGADGAFTGEGAFHISAWDPGKRAVLAANDDAPGGRPFLDTIEVRMGRTASQRLLDLEINQADFAEIPADQARQAIGRGIRVSASDPDELVAVAFIPGRSNADDPRAREAVSRAIDRPSIAGILLQKEGRPAGGILPQWCNGTALLFPTAADPAAARQLWTEIPGSPRLVLGYDSDDPLERVIAERVAVNAQEAGISITAQAIGSGAHPGLDARLDAKLIRWRMPSPHARPALQDFLAFAAPQAGLDPAALPDPASPGQIYQREQRIIGSFRVVPLVWLPEVYGLGGRVRNWTAPHAGEGWPLASVWLDGGAS